eukprot:12417304-Karenia_brevis.AAC.1
MSSASEEHASSEEKPEDSTICERPSPEGQEEDSAVCFICLCFMCLFHRARSREEWDKDFWGEGRWVLRKSLGRRNGKERGQMGGAITFGRKRVLAITFC